MSLKSGVWFNKVRSVWERVDSNEGGIRRDRQWVRNYSPNPLTIHPVHSTLTPLPLFA